MIGQRRQQELLLDDSSAAGRRRGEEGAAAGERMGLLARMRQAAAGGGRERLQRELQHQESIKRREVTYEEDAWARHTSADFGAIKLRHMQESEGTTQVSGDDYGELPAESEEEETENVQLLEEEDEEGEADDEKGGLYAYAYAELEKRLRGHKRDEQYGEAGGEEEEEGGEKQDDAFAAKGGTARHSEMGGGDWYYGAHLRRQRQATPVVEEEEGEEEVEEVVEEEEVGAGEAAAGEEDVVVEEPEEGEEEEEEGEEEEYEREEAATYTEEEEVEGAGAVGGAAAAIKGRATVEEGEEVDAYEEDAWEVEQHEEEEDHADTVFAGERAAKGDETGEGVGDDEGVQVEEEEEEEGWEREPAADEENVDEEGYAEEEHEAEKEEGGYEVGESLEEEVEAVEAGEEEEEDVSSETLQKEEDLTPYTLPQIESRVEVRHVAGKGRCLYTRNALEPGAIVFVESPVFVATPSAHAELWQALEQLNEEETFELPPVWHLGALCSLTVLDEDERAICLDKWIPEPNKAPSYDVLRVLERTGLPVHPQLYERMLMVWRYNSFGHHSEQPGLVLYNRISMMAHSCSASACWHYGEGDAFILRARVNLNAGDELTISYIGDEDLFKSSDVRREKVSGWLFTCQCPRCALPVDNARGFRCSSCATGSMFFKTEDGVTTSSPCTVCQSVPSEEIIKYYLEFEQAYVDRLAETDKTDLPDAKLVFFQAQRVFNQHWVLYQLHTILFEGHRDGGDYETAAFHQMERIKYVSQVMPLASYTLAWLHEELGDTLMTKEEQAKNKTYSDHKLHVVSGCFEDAYNLLYILCGRDHEYTIAADAKKTSCDQKLAALTSAAEKDSNS